MGELYGMWIVYQSWINEVKNKRPRCPVSSVSPNVVSLLTEGWSQLSSSLISTLFIWMGNHCHTQISKLQTGLNEHMSSSKSIHHYNSYQSLICQALTELGTNLSQSEGLQRGQKMITAQPWECLVKGVQGTMGSRRKDPNPAKCAGRPGKTLV